MVGLNKSGLNKGICRNNGCTWSRIQKTRSKAASLHDEKFVEMTKRMEEEIERVG